MQNNITFDQISVVMQGPIYDCTAENLLSVRKHLPGAEIILSTWEGSHTDGLVYDKVIFNEDPGSGRYHSLSATPNNCNRKIVSTISGLRQAAAASSCGKQYALILRTDFGLTGNDFLSYFPLFPKTDKQYQIFSHKILCHLPFNPRIAVPHWMIRNVALPVHYYPSDWAFFGIIEDLVDYFDVPLMSKDEEQYLIIPPSITGEPMMWCSRYIPEQHFLVNCMKKHGLRVYFDGGLHFHPRGAEETERVFASNFICLDFEQFNTKQTSGKWVTPEYALSLASNGCSKVYLTHIEVACLYKKYVDPEYAVPDTDPSRLKADEYFAKVKHCQKQAIRWAKLWSGLLYFWSRKRRREYRNEYQYKFIKRCLQSYWK